MLEITIEELSKFVTQPYQSTFVFRRSNSAMRTSSAVTYTKNITLSTEMIGTNVKFFNNSSFRTHMQQYLLNTYNVECQIRLLETQEIYLTLSGIKQNVKAARETIIELFESVLIKVYDDGNTDQQSNFPIKNTYVS